MMEQAINPDRPAVSVIVPCYNAQETICACIGSVLDQSYRNLEIIVVDDGSKDQSLTVLDDYLKQQRTISCRISIVTQKNMGPSAARNKGISMARGRYIAFLDADDQWRPDKLEAQIALLEQDPAIKLVSCGYNNQVKKGLPEATVISFRSLLKRNHFAATSTVTVCREVLDGCPFNEHQRYSEDYRLWLQIAGKHKCALINRPLARSVSQKLEYGQAGLSAALWKMEKGELENFRFLYTLGYISFPCFIAISCFSLLKYMRRKVIVWLKRPESR